MNYQIGRENGKEKKKIGMDSFFFFPQCDPLYHGEMARGDHLGTISRIAFSPTTTTTTKKKKKRKMKNGASVALDSVASHIHIHISLSYKSPSNRSRMQWLQQKSLSLSVYPLGKTTLTTMNDTHKFLSLSLSSTCTLKPQSRLKSKACIISREWRVEAGNHFFSRPFFYRLVVLFSFQSLPSNQSD